jgi:hypothetical protein
LFVCVSACASYHLKPFHAIITCHVILMSSSCYNHVIHLPSACHYLSSPPASSHDIVA